VRPDEILGIAWAVAWPPVWAVSWPRAVRLLRGRVLGGFWGSWITASATTAAIDAIGGGDPPATITAAVSTVFAVIMWWLNRRKRKRAPRTYGAKSRALIAAVIAKMRETAKPRPVLRPQPQGSS